MRWRRLGLTAAGVVVSAAIVAVGQRSVAPAAAAATGTAIAPEVTFMSTGAQQTYVVPAGVRLVTVDVQGAWGGAAGGGPGHYQTTLGQSGAAWQGLLAVKPGETLYVEVGSNGSVGGGATFGGGGAAGSADPEGAEAASGGGASDIRTCSEAAGRCSRGGTSADSRLIVAGGAGANGGSEVTAAAGLLCGVNAFGGAASNEQPLPNGNAALGPLPIKTPAGIVIPGYAGAGDFTPKTQNGDTDAGGGSTVAGAGGSGSTCQGGGAYAGVTFSGSVAGAAGSGPDGGAGGNAAGLAPYPCGQIPRCNDAGPGGGGGGGYFGGGGGVSGFPGPSNAVTVSLGGGAGSSFISKRILDPAPLIGGLLGSGAPYVRIAPVVQIIAPASAAVYKPGRVVTADWSCSLIPGQGNGVQNCTATVAVGGKINTRPGTHRFTVSADGPGNQPVKVSVTYTVGRRHHGHR
jgi:hypothetical protein